MRGEKLLRGALVALATLPALAILPGFEDGRLVFLDYREPKLIVALLLGTVFVALFVWLHGLRRASRALWSGLAESRELALFALLLGLMVLSGLWAAVPENWWYEARQSALFFLVAVLVRWWTRRRPPVAGLLAVSICGVTALVVLLGAFQAAGLLPWLTPIDPGYGVGYPSLLGYKNPMALAVIGQIFLLPLAAGAAEPLLRRVAGPRGRRLLVASVTALFVLECVYVAFLKSRTSYLALTLGLLVAAAVLMLSARSPALKLAPVAALAALALTFALHGGLRDRLLSAKIDYVDSWSHSDRATYLMNSIAMARHRPLGVGLGNWQTFYPVFRPHNPDVAFSAAVQPRRAHDDHAQLLGELGFPGLALWAAFWAVLLWRRFRAAGGADPLRSRVLGVQSLVWLVAMTGDFVLEHPYLKLLFFLVLALPPGFSTEAGDALGADSREESRILRRDRMDRLVRPLLLVLVLAVAWESVASTARLSAAGRLRVHYQRIAAASAAGLPLEALWPEVQQALAAGDRMVRGHGFTKTLYRDYLVLAETERLAGHPARAQKLAWISLRLHPYNSQALELLARLWAPVDTARSEAFAAASRRILEGPAAGFDGAYPRRAPLPPG